MFRVDKIAPLRDPLRDNDGLSGPIYRYGVYGIRLISDMLLDLPECSELPLAEIEIREKTPEFFAAAIDGAHLERRSDWYWFATQRDGSAYVRWNQVGEFLVSPQGRKISWLRAPGASVQSFQVYLLGQALSFALVRLGFEPLHGTAVVIAGRAIAFLGDTGFGKSTLAAQFLALGATLLTDDLLLLESAQAGVFAHAGPSRIKLFPPILESVGISASPGVPMNPLTGKQILPVQNGHRGSAPLHAIYVLSAPDETLGPHEQVRIESLSGREAFLALTANTFNYLLADPERLRRQVAEASRWIESVSIKRLVYPRSLARLPEVCRAVWADAVREDGP
jgi:hypothetical protein